MRKRIFVTLLLIGCLLLGGCGSSNESRPAVNSDDYEAAYEPEENLSDVEDDYSDEEYAPSDEADIEDEVETEPAEAKGIIAMVTSGTDSRVDVQLISIDPNTGSQGIISHFVIEKDTEYHFLWANNWYGNMRDWFSDDLSKMAVTKQFLDNYETHAGWLDTDGNFFDVTENVGAVTEKDFANPDPIGQYAIGFKENQFAFRDSAGEAYYVALNDGSDGTVCAVSDDDLYFYHQDHFSDRERPTAQIATNTFIIDDESVLNCPTSTILDIENDEKIEYIPESERYNWSGVINPSGDEIAFLSLSERASSSTVEIYTVPISGGNPANIQLVPNENTIVDIVAVEGYTHPFKIESYTFETKQCCFLLDWK